MIHHSFVENGSITNPCPSNVFKYRSLVLDSSGMVRPVTRLHHGVEQFTIQKAFPGDLVLTVEFDGKNEVFSLSKFLNHQHQGTMRKQLLYNLITDEMDFPPVGGCGVFDNLPHELKHFLFVSVESKLPDGFGWRGGVSREGYDKALFANKLFEFMPLEWLEGFVADISVSPRFGIDYDRRIETHVPNILDYSGTIPSLAYANPDAEIEWLLFNDNWDMTLSTKDNPQSSEGAMCAFKIYRKAFVYEGIPYGAYINFHTADGREFKPRRDSK